jgi:hypothetical protein
MPHVSLIVEALRARPVAVFWIAALAQASIWALLPALLYASPPGDLAELLAIGHEWQPGSRFGPPLASWLAELAFIAAGGHVAGVYILAQACILVAYWAVFALGRAVAGTQHAVLAVLLMTGILALSLPTPEFGATVLAAPLTALALLYLWRALGEGRRNYWIALAFDLGLLLLTSYWALLLFALIALFLLLTREGRTALTGIDPWAAAVVAVLTAFPHAVWLWQSGALRTLGPDIVSAQGVAGRFAFWPLLLLGFIALHAGLIALAVVASGWRADRSVPPPEIEGPPRPALAEKFVWYFALALPLAATLLASLLNTGGTAGWATPLVLMSGLAVVVAAGRRIALYRQRVLGVVWAAVLLVPPAALILVTAAAPFTGTFDFDTDEPAAAMARFFTETFRRRIGKPLPVVVGDARAVYIVAAASADRPRVYSAENPAQTPWLTDAAVKAAGAMVLWEMKDPAGQPPPAIRARFPDLVAEVPQTFERSGFRPALRIGWGVLRPQPPAAPPQ